MSTSSSDSLVWDWTVRLFHWLIVALIPLMWWTVEQGLMDWHRRLGLTLVGLLVFRLVWGFVGPWTARFLPMLQRLGSVPNYVREIVSGEHRPTFGHSPLGVLSVFALLALLCFQVTTGLFSVDVDGLESGPLAIFVSFDTGREIADLHELNFDFLTAFIVLHILAILAYRYLLNDRIIRPMITGYRPKSDMVIHSAPNQSIRISAFVSASVIALGSVYAVMNAG